MESRWIAPERPRKILAIALPLGTPIKNCEGTNGVPVDGARGAQEKIGDSPALGAPPSREVRLLSPSRHQHIIFVTSEIIERYASFIQVCGRKVLV